MKILHLSPNMTDASGVTVFAENIVAELRALGHEADLVRKGSPLFDGERREDVLKRYDIIHLHNLWSPWLHRWAQAAWRVGARVVWSPHGTLSPWAMQYKGFKKKVAWMLYQKRDLRRAHVIHVTAPGEDADVRRVGLKNPVVVVPLGVRMSADGLKREKKESPSPIKTLLFTGRVTPIKGLANLVGAMAASEGWRLRIVGPDEEGHTAELKVLAEKEGVAERIDFTGPKYGEDLENEYRDADCFVLPSFSENFGSVVVEAMAAGLPVIVSRGAPWQEVEERKCGRWVKNDPETLARTIAEMMALSDDERRAMGSRGRQLVAEKYQWPAIGRKMAAAYEDLSGRVEVESCRENGKNDSREEHRERKEWGRG